MAGKKGLKRWLQEQRASTRLAYALQLGSRICASLAGLIWTRLLVGVMGHPLNGVLLAFQNVTSLGGLGDLGMGGAVGIRTGQYLGKSDQAGLKEFLASARTVFLVLALAVGGGFLMLSPWLPHWLGFGPVPGMVTLNTSGTVPLLLPGRQYYLGVTNTGAVPARFTLEVDFGIAANTNSVNGQLSLPSKGDMNPTVTPLLDRIPSTNVVPPHAVASYMVQVASSALAATNILMIRSGQAGLLFNQNAAPRHNPRRHGFDSQCVPTGGTGSRRPCCLRWARC